MTAGQLGCGEALHPAVAGQCARRLQRLVQRLLGHRVARDEIAGRDLSPRARERARPSGPTIQRLRSRASSPDNAPQKAASAASKT